MLKRVSLFLAIAVLAVCAVTAWFRFQPTVKAQDNLTPGMLFGPLSIGNGELIKLCFTLLSEGDLNTLIHFRNLTTNEVTTGEALNIKSGGGGCVNYNGTGLVVGLARATAGSSDWVSPSNALIGTMSVISQRGGGDNGRTDAVVQGVPKIWVKGF
jgi:hypothetical protein